MSDWSDSPGRGLMTRDLERAERLMITSPIFLVGCVRSGTTLLRLMLDHHPDLAFDHEFEYAIDLVGRDGRHPPLDQFLDFLAVNRIFIDSGYRVDPSLDFPQLVDSFLHQKRDRAGKNLVGATIHRQAEAVLAIWPDARFIHIVRDGRDVCLSIEAYGWTGNAYTASDWWIDAERSWDDLCREVPPDRRVEVRFEELIERPEQTLGSICQFLNLDYSPRMLDYPADTTYLPPSRRRTDRWRTADPETVALIETRVGRMLAKRRYEPSGLPLPAITPGEHRRLLRQHRLYRATKRFQEQGPILFFADWIARRSKWKAIQRWVTLRLHAIERANLQ